MCCGLSPRMVKENESESHSAEAWLEAPKRELGNNTFPTAFSHAIV